MFLKFIQSQQMSNFYCIVTFIIAIQSWTWTACSGYTGSMTAAASVNSPGEIWPKSISIRVGDSANITCKLSTPNSSEIWFIKENSKQQFPVNSSNIEIIDDYTAVLKIHNATEQKSRYQCKMNEFAIGETEFYVGTEPKDITDFFCMSYDYENMECNFTSPNKNILTSYELIYRFARDINIYKCTCRRIVLDKWKCNINKYMPMRDEYLFTLKGTNKLGENFQNFTINNNKIVKPSPVEIKKSSVITTSSSVELSWEKKRYSYYKFGLQFHIQIRHNNSSWRDLEMPEFNSTKDIYNIIISDLYSYWTYWVKVKVKSKAVDNDNFWSDESTITFKTKAEEPKRSPLAPLGSFYIDSTETQLQLYWEEMPNYEHNGPGFHYIVNEKNETGFVVWSKTTNESSLTYPWKNISMREFGIKSANELGESVDESIIRVYRSGRTKYELLTNQIAKLYHNSRYNLTWSPPEKFDELLNYTVFWCSPKIELPNQCKGPISFKYLDKHETYFLTEKEDRSLNLAISANYPDYNKGMVWARCSAEVSSELIKMDIEVNALSDSEILVRWNTGTICSSILKSYNLIYCLESEGNNCKTIELSKEKKEYQNYTITNLPPYKNICIHMIMYSPTKSSLKSDEKCVMTEAAAPSPPQKLSYTKVTSKSALIYWNPPAIVNGILSHYTIYWRKYPDLSYENNTISISSPWYQLTDLSSYSRYQVFVTAHTIKESAPSEFVNFTTLIGIPSAPRNVNINDTVDPEISWDQPDLPSGRHLFYVVALIRRDEKQNEVYERVSIVQDRKCRFKPFQCSNYTVSYSLKVRAVNVGEKKEVDSEIVHRTKDYILGGAEIDEGFCTSEKSSENYIESESIFKNDIGKLYFASPWITASHSYGCAEHSNTPLYVVAFVILIIFAAYPCCWLRNKIYNMKNIKVILPEGLATQVSNYKYANNTIGNSTDLESTTKKEFHSDISRSNDCLVSYGQKENLNLINNFHNGSTNALSSLSSNSSIKNRHKEDEEQIGEHPSLETTNEELSSNSSSVSNSNFTYHDHRQIKRISSIDSDNTIPASVCDEEVDDLNENDENTGQKPNDESFQQHFNPQHNGYVTHNAQLLASILNGAEKKVTSKPQLNSTFPTMTNDGYIQPSAAKQLFQPTFSHQQQQQPATSINGYTSLETLGKLATPDDSRLISIPTSQIVANTPAVNSIPLNVANNTTTTQNMSSNTSPIITDLHESPSADFQKDSIQPNGTTTFSVTDGSQANNNNTIYGYVTQQQLANFGTNVALGKELNT